MFGIGFGELILILFLLFIISPKDIPKLLNKLGHFLKELNTIKDEITNPAHNNQAGRNKKKEKPNTRFPHKQKRTDS